MKYRYYIVVFSLFFILPLWSQNVETKIVFNNTEDIKQHKNVIEELKNAVNTNELQNSLRANENITDKNLKFEIAFFDRNYVGNLKLKAPHVLSVAGYKEKWIANVENRSAVLFLFVKEYGKTEYEFKGLSVSEQLEDQHLFEEVMTFINEHLNGSYKTIVSNGSKYLARAITPVWTKDKKEKALPMLNMDKYKKYHFNFYFNEGELFDLKATRQPIDANYLRVYFVYNGVENKIKITDTLKTSLPIYIDKRVFQGGTITIKDEEGIPQIGAFLSFWKPKEDTIALFEVDSAFYKFIEKLNLLQKVKNISMPLMDSNVSRWGWNKDFTPLNPNDFVDISPDYVFIVTKEQVKKIFNDGDRKPPWIAGYGNTYCNLFARDLSREILFSHSPWGTNAFANRLHWRIFHDSNFKKVPLAKEKNTVQKDAWTYTQAGYVVYYTAFGEGMNEDLLVTVSDESKIKHKPSGHIATCFEVISITDNGSEGKVIQAGNAVDILKWNTAQKAHVYLGYIIKD